MNAVNLFNCGFGFILDGSAFSYISVGAVYCVIMGQLIPIIFFINGVPLRFCAVEGNARKIATIRERISSDSRYAVRYGYARKRTATVERIILDTIVSRNDNRL